MKIKVVFLCLFLVIALAMSGCAGLTSGSGDDRTPGAITSTPETPGAITSTPETPGAITSTPETPGVIPNTPETPEATPSTTDAPRVQPAPSPNLGWVKPDNLPLNKDYLTEQEKAEVIRIASEAAGFTIDQSKANFVWFGKAGGTGMIVDYDAVEKGIPDVVGARDMTFYPAIGFKLDSGWGMTVVVDLQNGKALEVRGPTPNLSSPDRFKK